MAAGEAGYGPGWAHFSELRPRRGDFEEDDIWVASSSLEEVEGEVLEVLKTPEELMEELWSEIQERYWFMKPEYLGKEPLEQWSITFRDHTIPVYRYTDEVKLSDSEIHTIGKYISLFSARFPQFYTPLTGGVVITNTLPKYTRKSGKDFTTESEVYYHAQAIALAPTCFEDGLNKMGLPHLESAIIHELAHFKMDEALEADWEDMGLTWREYQGLDGDIYYQPSQPDRCASAYSKAAGIYEDIADSAVVYMLSGNLDHQKKDAIASRETWMLPQDFDIEQVDTPVQPLLPKELIYYLDDEIPDRLPER